MRVIYTFLMALILISAPVFAQDQSSGDDHQPPSTDEIVSKMQSKLNLTQDQVTAVTPIIEKYSSKREALHQSMEDGTADRDSIRTQMKQLKSDEVEELGQVLSADQVGQWQKMLGQHMHKHNNETDGGSGPGGDNPPQGE